MLTCDLAPSGPVGAPYSTLLAFFLITLVSRVPRPDAPTLRLERAVGVGHHFVADATRPLAPPAFSRVLHVSLPPCPRAVTSPPGVPLLGT